MARPSRQPDPHDLADAEWILLESLLPASQGGGDAALRTCTRTSMTSPSVNTLNGAWRSPRQTP